MSNLTTIWNESFRLLTRAHYLFLPFITANLIILLLWTILDPLRWTVEIESEDAFGRALEVRGRCNSDNRLPFLICLMAVNFGALCFAAYESHRSRRISTEFHESRYIFSAVFSILLVCLVCVPVAILAQDNTDALFFVFSAILSVSTCSILLFIFVPKIHYWKKSLRRQRENRIRVSGLYNIEPGAFDDIAGSFNEDDMDESERSGPDGDHGMKVLSFKSKEQLIRENRMLLKETKTLSTQNVNLREQSSRWSKMMSAERFESIEKETDGLLEDEDDDDEKKSSHGLENGTHTLDKEAAEESVPDDEPSAVAAIAAAAPERAPLSREDGSVGGDESRPLSSEDLLQNATQEEGSSSMIHFDSTTEQPVDDLKTAAWQAPRDEDDNA